MTDRERDAETGKFVDKYPQEALLEAIRELGGIAATSEVAEAVAADRNTVYKKLQSMEGEGDVSSRKAGGIRVWEVEQDGN